MRYVAVVALLPQERKCDICCSHRPRSRQKTATLPELPLCSGAVAHTFSWLYNPLIHAACNQVAYAERALVQKLQDRFGPHWNEIMTTISERASDPTVASQVRSLGSAYLPAHVQDVCIGFATNPGMREMYAFAKSQHRAAVSRWPTLVVGSCDLCCVESRPTAGPTDGSA